MDDIRDILNTNTESKQKNPIPTGQKSVIKKKRPDGMPKDLFDLITEQGSGLSLDTVISSDYRDNPKAKWDQKNVRPWKWTPFVNPGRKDGVQFCHWERPGDKLTEYPFAKFNKEVPVPQYSDSEYAAHLDSADGWSKAETDHLFDLCKRFDLRFSIVHDRWDLTAYGPKSMEDLKDRYYSVCNILNKLRCTPGEDLKVFYYDAEHEKRRKEQLKKLWNRSREECEEEEYLRAELKRIEIRKKDRERKMRDLQKLIAAIDGSSGPSMASDTNAAAGNSGAFSQKKNAAVPTAKKKIRKENNASVNPSDAFSGIRWTEFKSAGPFLRSQKSKMPSTVGQKRVKAIDQILKQMKVDNPPPTDETTVGFNDLRTDIMLLYELKSALATSEMEVHSVANQFETLTGNKLDIPNCLSSDTYAILSAIEGVAKSSISTPSTPTTSAQPTLAGSLRVGDLDVVIPSRKRKAALEQSNVLRKLKSKNPN